MQVMFTSSDGSALETGNDSITDYHESQTSDCATKRLLGGEKITYLYRSTFRGWGVACKEIELNFFTATE